MTIREQTRDFEPQIMESFLAYVIADQITIGRKKDISLPTDQIVHFISQETIISYQRRFINGHSIAIVTTQTFECTKPHTPQFVLTDGND